MASTSAQCALCSLMVTDTIKVFGFQGQRMKIAEILVKHFQFLVNEINGWTTKGICTECWLRIEAFHMFYQVVYFTHQQTLVAVDTKREYGTEENCKPNPMLFVGPIADRIKDDFPDPIYKKSREDIKFECSDDKGVATTGLNPSIQIRTYAAEHPMVEKSKATELTEADEDRNIELEKIVPQYFHMACDLCEYKFDSWLTAKEHYLQQHNISRAYLKCCNKKYIMRGRILHHVSWHIDPNAFTCNVCSRRFNEKRALTSHLLRHTDENNRQFACDKCNKRFTRKHKLNRHMIDVHPIGDQKFHCDFCQKSFKLEQTLKTHISKVHERAEERICDICARIFKSKEGFQDHMVSHRETEEPRVQCTHCGIWLKNKGSLNKHVKMHTEKPQTCEICNKIKPTRSALRNHMQIVHGEAIYECTICEKKFKRQLTLTEHIASHTGQNLYTCPYCPKMFKSNSNMHKHRKHSHREQWTLNRSKKQLIYANRMAVKS